MFAVRYMSLWRETVAKECDVEYISGRELVFFGTQRTVCHLHIAQFKGIYMLSFGHTESGKVVMSE